MPAPDLDVLCMGEALVDLLPEIRGRLRDCERFTVHSGGAPANVAVGLARLGLRTGFLGVVGEDELGYLLARKLADEGIDCTLRFTNEAPTGLWFVALDARGERTFFTPTGARSADKRLAPEDLADALLARARGLHCGSSAHVDPRAQEALRQAVKRARASGLRVSFDPNLRPHLWTGLGELRRLVCDVFPSCNVVKLADDELEICLGVREPERAAAMLVDLGVELACITLGARGALIRRGEDVFTVAAPSVDAIDTTGAGDGFVAGLLSRLIEVDRLETMPREALEEAAKFACFVGSRVCTQLGAVAGLPRRGERSDPT